MVKVFGTEKTDKRVSDVLKETLTVYSDGSVSFRVGLGKGSGRAVKIPADEFDDFVRLVNETASRRTDLATQAQASTQTE